MANSYRRGKGIRLDSLELRLASPKRDAFAGVLGAFRKYNVVALDEPHWDQMASEFIIELVHQSGFADKVNDIVFECGNSGYQKVLDRYISAGEGSHVGSLFERERFVCRFPD